MTAGRNLGNLIHDTVQQHPEKLAIIAGDVSLTYTELNNRMNKAGNLFISLGVRKGDRVAVLLPNDYRFIEICFGIMRIGAVPVPINIKLGNDILSYIAGDSGAKVLVFHETLEKKASAIRELNPFHHVIELLDRDEPSALHYDALLAKQSADLDIVEVQDDDLCFLPYTSGSTGRPKGCMLTHAGQIWNMQSLLQNREIVKEDRALIAVPLYHKNAMTTVKTCLMGGASLVLLPGVNPKEIFEAIEKHRCTLTGGVPAMYKMLLSYYKSNPVYNLDSLTHVSCGSSEVPPELVSELREIFRVEIIEGYGLTEGGPNVFSMLRGGEHRQGSTGHALPGCQVRIVDKDGKELPVGEVGELWVKNPGVAKGYWNRPEATAERITPDGWLKTGDLFRMDNDGYAYYVSRKDDMINIGGENAYPKEIENILLRHPEIADVCVVGMEHAVKGQAPAAYIVTAKGSRLSEKEVVDYFIQHGPAFAHPRVVIFLEALPLSGTGKTDRSELTNRLKNKQAQ